MADLFAQALRRKKLCVVKIIDSKRTSAVSSIWRPPLGMTWWNPDRTVEKLSTVR